MTISGMSTSIVCSTCTSPTDRSDLIDFEVFIHAFCKALYGVIQLGNTDAFHNDKLTRPLRAMTS